MISDPFPTSLLIIETILMENCFKKLVYIEKQSNSVYNKQNVQKKTYLNIPIL